jgi:hypothetical protein
MDLYSRTYSECCEPVLKIFCSCLPWCSKVIVDFLVLIGGYKKRKYCWTITIAGPLVEQSDLLIDIVIKVPFLICNTPFNCCGTCYGCG